jgi:Tol biopolymer transport system component
MRKATLVACVAVFATLGGAARAQEKVTLANRESPWGKIPFDAGAATWVVISADGRHGAYVTRTDEGYSVVVDGKPTLDKYQRVATDSFVFIKGPAGERFAFAAKLQGSWRVFENERPADPYDEISGSSLCFSPGGDHLAFVATLDKKTIVVLDEQPQPPCDSVGGNTLVFNASGDRLAYVVRRKGRASLVLDGKVGPAFDDVGRPVFSGDGRHVAYTARNGERWMVVRDGQELAAPSAVVPGTMGLSSDGGRLAYAIRTAAGMRMVDGERLGDGYEWVFDGSTTFSPDGKRLAYAVRRGRSCAVVVDDKPADKSFDGVVPSSITFSRDGKRLAYVAEIVRDGRVARHAVVDDRVGPGFARIRSGLRFNPSGANLAYVAELDDGHQCLVVDGTAGKPYACIRGEPVFNANGSGVGALALVEDDRFEAGEEIPTATDSARDNGRRVVFDRSWDLRVHGRPRNTMPALPWQNADQQEWRTRPLEIKLVMEQIRYD